MEHGQNSLLDLQVDQQCAAYLLETAKWNRFLAIVWFILCGLMIVFALFAGTMFAAMFRTMPGMENASGALGASASIIITGAYLVMAAFQLIPNIFRYKFATQAINAVRSNDQALFNRSINNLRIYSKFWGIVTIIIIAFYVVIFIIALVGGAMVSRGGFGN
ncbi:hypothetical protein HHL16_16700 [Pseudoflavitalea sp. G-6-1-2]|uniref:hypothetical protein n=1 Tax=Pseudoflavitalea sp. G-6-1-2 TaxID=2728841 RepID=UPI00146D7A4F|nr:hypothetical protein [Pseudoflavitalea sp. G-6-1-2]NML22524.1 hypothetical protein [Pseudoflavitalea sp. G-6-1-2]